MKILKADVGALDNFEVFEFLKSKGASKNDLSRMGRVTKSEYKVFDYLVDTPAGTYTRESIEEFKEKCKHCENLGNDKILNIINTRPASVVEIYAIVGDDADELLELVTEVLTPAASSPQPEAGTDEIDAETMNVEEVEQDDGNKEKPGSGEAPMETS